MRRIVLMNLALTALLVGAFDLVAFFLIPGRYLTAFANYRVEPDSDVARAEMWPRNYYVADKEMGFDIGVNRVGIHKLPEMTYPIWSDSLGCFDKPHADYAGHVYFAGDSFTWGHAAYEQKFGSLIEQKSGTPILKCGVEHTGQRHEYEKFISVESRTGVAPRAVFVFFFQNDIANDYAYPHSTVIDGWLVDAVWLNSRKELVRLPDAELTRRLKEEEEQARLQDARAKKDAARPLVRLKAVIRQYSLAGNLVGAAIAAVTSKDNRPASPRKVESGLEHFYTVPYIRSGSLWYRDNPYARPNQRALLAFKEWTTRNGASFAVVIIPRRDAGADSSWHRELHEFLKLNRIRYLDLAASFSRRRANPAGLYWDKDGHLNARGNEAVADILIAEFPGIFKASRPRPVATAVDAF